MRHTSYFPFGPSNISAVVLSRKSELEALRNEDREQEGDKKVEIAQDTHLDQF